MHVHELNPKRTMIALVIFAVIIVVGLLTLSGPRLKYALNPEQTIELVTYGEGMVYPYELEDVLNGSIDSILLWDIRNTFEFGRGHIPGAENISAVNLLTPENIKRLKQLKEDGMAVVLYGKDQLHANGPWMVFRQLGCDHVNILMGGYDYYAEWQDMLGDTYYDDVYLLGMPDFDYVEEAASAVIVAEEPSGTKAAVTVKRKKKTVVAEGGC